MTDAPADAADVVAWHALASTEALERLDASENGLTEDEADRRRERYGENALPENGGGEAWRILLGQLRDPLIYVLLGSTALAILTGKVLDGAVIGGVVVLNALIGFVQEYRASRAIAALTTMVPSAVVVTRAGRKRSLPAVELVPGDVVHLEAGDRTPADLRLLRARGLMIEEAALTGESAPAAKGTDPVEEDAGIGDRRSIAYSGTLVTRGAGSGVVVATGASTELGRISRMLGQATDLETPLTRQLGVIARYIAIAIVVVSILLLGVGLWRGYPLADAVLAAVTLAVAAIPEGLPAIVTIALAIGVRRMAGRQAIIRKLPAVETLGSTTVICSDKTGTLTRNEMTVQVLWTPGGLWRLGGVGYAPEGDLSREDGALEPAPPGGVEALVRAGALCNDAALRQDADGGWSIAGDPTEGALLTAAAKLGLSPDRAREERPRLDAIPFASERQFMATLHAEPDGGRAIYVKGAPEVVLRRCDGPGDGPLDGALDVVHRIAAEGMRVLAVAVRRPESVPDDLEEEDVAGGFTLLGFQGMIDPPRPEARDAVAACKQAGMAVKMITGDHGATAAAIGRSLGLAAPEGAVPGSRLEDLSDEEMRDVAARADVFARVAPEHKLRLVKALQADGHVVAMTGDGVNDAPALKQADIGVAMGITGTAVSKEAADMVLADDNFASIRAAVEEGRRVYDNLVKALAFVLPTNLGLALIMIASVAAFPIVDGEPVLPMRPAQILWINLVAAVALALPLAFEAKESDLMRRPPRLVDAPVLSPFVLARTVLVAILMTAGALALFVVAYAQTPAPGSTAYASAQTQAVTTVIFFQIFYLLDCRSLRDPITAIGPGSNPWIFGGIALTLALQIAFVHLPAFNVVFGSTPLDLRGWAEAALVGAVILPVIGMEKWIRRRSAT
ncbi:HAD-IC family P-type ATPase [Salinarimonas sp.]|uniref:cation-translocating P-type ATPase n=1 Tax=Salinarimonas sp. TaxID=2766526 RepID=UPI0032D8F1BF